MKKDLAIVALPGADAAAGRLAALLGARTCPLDTHRFPDGERYLRLEADVLGAHAVIVGHLLPPDEQAMALWFLADALRDLGARRVGLVLPYLPYMRQDARFNPGEAVTSAAFARLLSIAADWLVTVDPHLHRHRSLAEIYTIASTAVSSAPVIAQWVREQVPRPVIVGPDEESEQWVADVAAQVGCPHRVMRKQRTGDQQVRVHAPSFAGLRDRTPVLLDDIVSSGHTMAEAVRCLTEAGLAPPSCIAVHGVFANGALKALRTAGAGRIVTCNTLPGEGEQIDVLPAVAHAVAERVG
jgi:ribose-phosphate pyrophosphokinase